MNNNIFEKEDSSTELYQKILQHASTYRVPVSKTKEQAFDQLMAGIALTNEGKASAKHRSIKTNTLYWVSSIAATLLLAMVIGQLYIRGGVENVFAPRGQQSEYKLPDGSLVSLNAESEIEYNKKKFVQQRNLKLEGEAFFSIKKGSSFTINTAMADIRVLGTSFNVFAREGYFKVACVTGKVEVTSGEQMVILTPEEYAVFENSRLLKHRKENIGEIANWRNGEFYYESASLKLIFEELERQFNVNFVVSDMEGKFFTGSFTNKNLVDALDIVCIPMNLTYEIGKNSQIFITAKQQ